ncbi:hypothetical protein QWY15_03400 [Planococcus sp. N064]|uniref:Uncharacterized protein n=1 Tax=Planococcus liqunii TaxID=3058394 RepID=A0ABT8MN56_9BACL|nr:hypothetical protein [Planococcus sp. N064]MDN7226332.1 hypothetical protein [Planococcus sp. N064]
MVYYFIAAKGILGVKTNIKEFKWSFGSNMPEGTLDEYENCAVKMHIALEEFNDDDLLGNLGRYHYFNGSPGEDKLYYTRKLPINKKLRLKAENLLSDEPKITVNRTYYKLITHRIMNLHSLHYIATDLAALLLLRKGYAPIHCSAFKAGDATVAIFAPPDTGKTLSAMTACGDFGASFIAEDLAITDGKNIFSVPWTNSFDHYAKNKQTKNQGIKEKFMKSVPIMNKLSRKTAEPEDNNVKAGALLNPQMVTHIAILEKGEDGILPQAESAAVSKLMNLNRYEFNFLRAPLLIAYEFFNPELVIDNGTVKEKEILSALVRNSESVFTLKKRNPTHYAKALLDQMEEVPYRNKKVISLYP